MSRLNCLHGIILVAAAFSMAACSSDSGGGSFGGTTRGTTTTPIATPAIASLGVTGSGGVTDSLGVAALTDPILGTGGMIGGGSEGLVGGVIPTGALAPLSNVTAPIVGMVASALPLDAVTAQLPGLGVSGQGGLVNDLTGQDLLTSVIGSNGTIPALIGGGNDGVLGNIIPAGTVPQLPGLSSLPSAGLLTGLTSGTPLAAITSAAAGSQLPGLGGGLPSAGEVGALTGILANTLQSTPPANLIGTVTGLVNPSKLTGALAQINPK